MSRKSKRVRFGILASVSCLALATGFVYIGCYRVAGYLAVPLSAINESVHNDLVKTIGDDVGSDSSASTHEVSEHFGVNELQRLYERLNSADFQATLAKYNCGDPVPKFRFRVSLHEASQALSGARRVAWEHTPGLSPVGRTRGLMFGLDYCVDKVFAEIDPTRAHIGREPHLDCSKRDSNEEWVTFPVPGPEEQLLQNEPVPTRR